jgi:hypothetical protein
MPVPAARDPEATATSATSRDPLENLTRVEFLLRVSPAACHHSPSDRNKGEMCWLAI